MVLTKSDFDKYKVNEVLARRDEKAAGGLSAFSYWSVCGEERRRLEEAGDDTGNELFGLLTDVSSMGFWDEGSDPEKPFSPLWTGLVPGKRSCLPEDLGESDLSFLAEIVHDVEESIMRARIADILWLRRHGLKRGYYFAVLAHDSYLASVGLCNPDFYTWNRLRRALQIATLLNDPEKREFVLRVARELTDALAQTDKFALWIRIVELLATYSKDMHERNRYAEQIWQRASEFEQKKDFGFAVRGMEDAIALFKQLGKRDRANEAQLELAEALENHATTEASSGNFGRAHYWIEQAISHVMEAEGPKGLREKLGLILAEYGKKSAENMDWREVKVEFPEEAQNAIKEIAGGVTETVKGKTLEEALYSIVVGNHPVDAESIKSHEQKLLRTSIAPHTVRISEKNQAGKVVSREWPLVAGRLAMNFRMPHVAAVVQPAIMQINDDHEVSLEDIVEILGLSRFVPEYSKWTFATGILAGFRFDLVTIAHVIPPMLENAFRELLGASGVDTSRLDKDMVSQERSFSWILQQPPVVEVLGEDLLFDLRSLLLSDEGGLNIRNNVSHGLLGDGSFFLSADGKNSRDLAQILYLWWLTLKMCLFHQAAEHFERQSNSPESLDID